jgi:hypothetical protein
VTIEVGHLLNSNGKLDKQSEKQTENSKEMEGEQQSAVS